MLSNEILFFILFVYKIEVPWIQDMEIISWQLRYLMSFRQTSSCRSSENKSGYEIRYYNLISFEVSQMLAEPRGAKLKKGRSCKISLNLLQ